jgi:CDP-glycerol glycerophosphotransferase (TagB/SpsB family)
MPVRRFRKSKKVMILSNLLLTDYSSIYVDYLLLEKPIVFYALDLEKYMQYRGW